MSNTTQTIATVLSVGVILSALAGLFVAIQNIRKASSACNARSLSFAYIVFFIVAVLSMFGAGGAIFRGTELAAGAGITIAAFSSLALFVIGVMLLFAAQNITDTSLRNTNIAIFSIMVGLSLANTVFLLVQRQNLITTQPVVQGLNYVRNRFRRGGDNGSGYDAGYDAVSPARA